MNVLWVHPPDLWLLQPPPPPQPKQEPGPHPNTVRPEVHIYRLLALGRSGCGGDMILPGDAAGWYPGSTGGIHRLETVVPTRLGAAAISIKGGPIKGIRLLLHALSMWVSFPPRTTTPNTRCSFPNILCGNVSGRGGGGSPPVEVKQFRRSHPPPGWIPPGVAARGLPIKGNTPPLPTRPDGINWWYCYSTCGSIVRSQCSWSRTS